MEGYYKAIVSYVSRNVCYHAYWQGNASSKENAQRFAISEVTARLTNIENAGVELCYRFGPRNVMPSRLVHSMKVSKVDNDLLRVVRAVCSSGELEAEQLADQLKMEVHAVMVTLGTIHARLGLTPGETGYFAYALAKASDPLIEEPDWNMQVDATEALKEKGVLSFDELWKYAGHYKKTAFAFCLGWLLGEGQVRVSLQGWKAV